MPAAIASLDPADPDIELATLRAADRSTRRRSRSKGMFESRGGVRLPDLGRFEDEIKPFTETTRVRVWYAAPDRWRADDITIGGERGFYREPDGVWQCGDRRPRSDVLAALPARSRCACRGRWTSPRPSSAGGS